MSKNWLITGASRGFGKEFARNALGRGDRVAATARNATDLEDLSAQFGDLLLPLVLDVTDREAVFATVGTVGQELGRIDVVVNNAGYGLFGAIEEITEEQLRNQLEVNLFGPFHVIQAVLPTLRTQGSGHIIQISSLAGILAHPNLGGYHASKWALEGLSESLAQEVAQFGIKVTLIEPGGYATEFGRSSTIPTGLDAYAGIRQAMAERAKNQDPSLMGDPVAAGAAILKIVDAEEPPLRAFFGTSPLSVVEPLYARRLDTWREWQPLSVEANGR